LDDSNTPSVSVIIPVLNEEKLISRTLSQFTSRIKKKFNIEIIVSDGGSTDNTVSLAKNFCCDKIVTPEGGMKQNIPIGRNMGAKNSTGDLLYFFNGDTMIQNIDSFFTETLEYFKNPEITALTCNVRVFPDEVKISDKLFHTLYNNYVFVLNKFGIGMGRGECQMIRREYFFKLGGYNEKMAAGEDFDLYKRLKKFGKIKFLRDIVVYESPRRYRKYGYSRVFWAWTKNALSVFFRGKALSKEWEQVR